MKGLRCQVLHLHWSPVQTGTPWGGAAVGQARVASPLDGGHGRHLHQWCLVARGISRNYPCTWAGGGFSIVAHFEKKKDKDEQLRHSQHDDEFSTSPDYASLLVPCPLL